MNVNKNKENNENAEIMRKILDKIKEYRRIIIMRHVRPDGDAIGSTKGLQAILKLSFPEKEIYLQNEDTSDFLDFMGKEDIPLPDDDYRDALGIIIDTANIGRVANKRYDLCREIVKIDHHIDDEPYGDLSWVEDFRSSACEMIAAFYSEFSDELKINTEAATYIYTGMVTDSGRFKFNSTSGDTLRYAAMILDLGVDTETLFAHLYLEDFNKISVNADITRNIKLTENGVAYLYITNSMRESLGMSQEEASATVSLMESIKGSLIWLAFIENDDGASVRVRLRSRFVTIKSLANKYHGGGHECASGATVYSRDEFDALLKDADDLLRDYKATHHGWL